MGTKVLLLIIPILSIFTSTEAKRHFILSVKLRVKQLAVNFKNRFLQAWHTASSQLNTKACWATHTANYLECSPHFVVAKVPILWIIQFKSGLRLTLTENSQETETVMEQDPIILKVCDLTRVVKHFKCYFLS